MRRVCVAGCGTIPFTNSTDERLESVLLHSARNMLAGSKCGADGIDAVLVANAAGGYGSTGSDTKNANSIDDTNAIPAHKKNHNGTSNKSTAPQQQGSGYMASILAELAGVHPKISHTVESLCSSGSNAIVAGYAYIASNLADAVMVSGAEMRDTRGRILWWDDSRGQFKHPIFWASLFTRGYKRAHDISDEDLAVVPARAFANAQANPDALVGRPHTTHDVMQSDKLTADLRLLDCSRPCTGGATVLLASEDAYPRYTDAPVWITGIGQKTTSAGFAKTQDLARIESTEHACRDAFSMAQRGAGSNSSTVQGMSDVDVAEIHDAFSVCEPMILEALGMAEFGGGARASRDLYETQSRRINPRGGLIGSGHPLGATGVAQAVEIVRQLQSEAHGRQADSPKTGLVHNMAAAGTSSTVMIMQR